MRAMTRTVDGGVRQKLPDTHEETLSKINIAAVPFNMNESSVLCLPLVSDSKQLMWVQFNQINLQLDGAAELDKAFDKFPYLTQKKTAELAQRCSLHPDQVKVWFMVQRLCYGISWDYQDIVKVQRKFNSSQEKEELQNNRGEKNKCNRKVKESVREEQSTMEQLEKIMKYEKPMKEQKDGKVEELEKHKGDTRKRMQKKRRIDEGVAEREEAETRDELESTIFKPTPSEKTFVTGKKKKANAYRLLSVQEWPVHKSFVVSDDALDMCPPLIQPSQNHASDVPPLTANPTPNIRMAKMEAQSTNPSGVITDFGEVKEPNKKTSSLVVAGGFRRKTQSQLMMLKMVFLRWQYPDSKVYNQLETLIGIPRYILIQWFSDMRYYIKKAQPRWMTQKQHSQVLANIKYQQCLKALAKPKPRECCGKQPGT